eukprot:CAMPEP_0194217838 /NCGR_PEP_ID=MMETSP0156-20130528/22365_1 /TAXON_ID=33649 /ORGANISM="Thalassionema nitzschioides, Strain L26-B" /LENGTH=52 /DNA_ID=CAMNT_0038946983 /DNA_START=190 /DNA_END=345 /DNA_ORIENTATION=+
MKLRRSFGVGNFSDFNNVTDVCRIRKDESRWMVSATNIRVDIAYVEYRRILA